uniref:Uncharacterized protein n=1 Tax=Anguilla anguilla TaxID=7936 RepID=A0A0E9UDL0_ANGAN
MMQEIFKMIRF